MMQTADSYVPEYIRMLGRPHGPFPFEAIRRAVERREEATRWFLRSLDRASMPGGVMSAMDDKLPTFAMYLLAEFRERRGFPPLLRLAHMRYVDDLLGDALVEGLGRALASVSDGDPAPMQRVVEDSAATQYARSAVLDGIGAMYYNKQLERVQMSAYLHRLMSDPSRVLPSIVWSGVVSMSADFRFHEHIERIRAIYHEQRFDPDFEPLALIEARIHQSNYDSMEMKSYELIDDTERELSSWPCFQ